ncbi:MAG: radical SAM superfamily enzyme YgiQ (UPF0313 family) [Glaciecola sp.]|jgi:radical SAM superfamily enzyme YgiQ (UPF0313 family)
MVLGDADLALLECIAKFEPMQNLIEVMLAHPLIKSGFSALSQLQLENRIKQYKKVDAWLDTPSDNPPTFEAIKSATLVTVKGEQALESEIERTTPLRLSTHFGLALSPKGYSAWSATKQTFVALNASEAAIIMAFGDGQTIAEVIAKKQSLGISKGAMLTAVYTAEQTGLLTDIKENISTSMPKLVPFETETITSLGFATDWKEMPKNDKIPVYFVPHMENHFPLALGVLFSALVSHNEGVLLEQFQFIPVNYLSPNYLLNGPYRKFGPGVWLFSNYIWSIDVNMQISSAIKQKHKANFTIHGGPSTPDYEQACQDFLTEHPSVDIAVHGEGEVSITEIFECIAKNKKGIVEPQFHALSKVPGITYREGLTGRFIRTQTRARMKTPDSVPSPYLSGLFDGYQGRIEAAIIETNRGCPYGCTFCDWGSATNQKIRRFDLQRVKDEITWIGKNKVRVMWIADANYGLYDRDIEISQFIVDIKKEYGYPQEIVVNYTKNSTWRLVEIIKIFTAGKIIGQGIISIQTTDEETLDVINRKNIRTERYDELAQAFIDLNLPLSTDLMIGLPGQTVASFTGDLQRYIDMDVSVKAYPTQLLPNSPMAEPGYMKKYEIKADSHSFLTSTYSYTQEDIKRMKAIYEVYVMADGYSLLRYVIRYLQWEHNIPAMTFMQNILDDANAAQNAYPLITWAVRYFNKDKSMPSGWSPFYQQITEYIQQKYSLKTSTGLITAISVNRAAMPDDGLNYPIKIELDHDFISYFHQYKESQKPLHSYSKASMLFSDPNRLSTVDLNSAQYDSHQYFWELYSDVARAKSLAEFAA